MLLEPPILTRCAPFDGDDMLHTYFASQLPAWPGDCYSYRSRRFLPPAMASLFTHAYQLVQHSRRRMLSAKRGALKGLASFRDMAKTVLMT